VIGNERDFDTDLSRSNKAVFFLVNTLQV